MKSKIRLYYVMYFDGSHSDHVKYTYAQAEEKRKKLHDKTGRSVVLWPIIEEDDEERYEKMVP